MTHSAGSVTLKASVETEEVGSHGAISHVLKAAASKEWVDWKNILKFCPQVLFHTSACGAICSTVSYRAQVGEALPTEPLGALSVVVL